MRRIIIFLSLGSFLFVFGCSELPVDPLNGKSDIPDMGSSNVIGIAGEAEAEFFVNEPPALTKKYHGVLNETASGAEISIQGEASFFYFEAANVIQYSLQLKNRDEVDRVYIALYQKDGNGRLFENVVLLYPAKEKFAVTSGEDKTSGISGIITRKDLFGSLQGQELESLLIHFEQGTAYMQLFSSFSRSIAARGAIL